MFLSSWFNLLRVLVVGVLAYASLVFLLRISGKRTLSKMNAFDMVVTFALGSTLATMFLSKDVALAEGVVAFAVLIGMQFVVTWLSVRSETVRKIVKSEPTLLFHHGEFLRSAMRRERVTEEEVLSAVRTQGHLSVSQVEAVVLETDASFSVLGKSQVPDQSALRGVRGTSEI